MVQQKDRHVSIDSCVLIDFLEVGRADLIENIWSGRIHLATSIVRVEIKDYPIEGFHFQEFIFETEDHHNFSKSIQGKYRKVSASDADAIAVAHFTGSVCISNDAFVREACKGLGLEVGGTLTVLKMNVKSGKLNKEEAVGILEQIKKNGAYFGDQLIQQFLKELGDENSE